MQKSLHYGIVRRAMLFLNFCTKGLEWLKALKSFISQKKSIASDLKKNAHIHLSF